MLGNPMAVGRGVNELIAARKRFREYFAEQGEEFTKGYLSAFTGLRKFLAEQSLSGESNKYHGAKMSLEFVSD